MLLDANLLLYAVDRSSPGSSPASTIRTSDPDETFKFERASRLSPVPGIPNTWR